MASPRNPVGWFEIPATDLERARRFYETVMDCEMSVHDMGPLTMAWFPMDDDAPGAAGALVHMPEAYTPSHEGTLIYFTTPSGNLDTDCAHVRDAGGRVIHAPKSIGEHGFIAVVEDTEGNRIAFHSRK